MDRQTPSTGERSDGTGSCVRSRTPGASPTAWAGTPRAHRVAAGAGLLVTLVVGATTVAVTLAEHHRVERAPAAVTVGTAPAGVPSSVGAELLRTWGLDLDPGTGLVVPAQSRLPALPGLVDGAAGTPSAPGDMSPTVAAP